MWGSGYTYIYTVYMATSVYSTQKTTIWKQVWNASGDVLFQSNFEVQMKQPTPLYSLLLCYYDLVRADVIIENNSSV